MSTLEKIANIKLLMKLEAEKREKIIKTLEEELDTFAKENPKHPYVNYGNFNPNGNDKKDLNSRIIRKYIVLQSLEEINQLIKPNHTYRQVRENAIKAFEMIGRLRYEIPQHIDITDHFLDFFKSIANHFIYALSLFQSPGFFTQTDGELKETQRSLSRSLRLIEQQDKLIVADELYARTLDLPPATSALK